MPAGNFRFIPEEQKKLVLMMSLRGMANKDIASATGIADRTIRRLLRQWNQTGEVVKHPIQTGRPRIMSSLEVSVSSCHFRLAYVVVESLD